MARKRDLRHDHSRTPDGIPLTPILYERRHKEQDQEKYLGDEDLQNSDPDPETVSGDIEVQVNDIEAVVGKTSTIREMDRLHIQRFEELVEAGQKPSSVARKLGLDLDALMAESEEVRRELHRIVLSYSAPASARKELARALMTKIAVTKHDSDPQVALKALELMAKDLNLGREQVAQEEEVSDNLKKLFGIVDAEKVEAGEENEKKEADGA